MKHSYLFLITFLLLSTTNLLKAQSNENTVELPKTTIAEEGFQKGTSQIAIQGISLALYNGELFGGAEFRYGYFIANNNLLFIDGGFNYWGSSTVNSIKLGLHYRRYFTDNTIKPFAQVGFNRTWSNWGNPLDNPSIEHDFRFGGGAAVQIKRFGIEAGVQCIVSHYVSIAPLVGFTFKF